MKIRLLSVLLLILFSLTAHAQKKSRISGTVVDSEGNPLEIVTVSIRGRMMGAMTNEKGFYSLSISTGDSCTLIFSCLGYNKTQRIIPSVDGDMQINVTMNNIELELEGVTVQGSRIQTNTMDKLDPKKSKLMTDASGGNIESLIVTFGSGVSSTNELSSQYSVRGGSYDENIVYVNGIEVYRPLLIRSGQQEGLSFINPDMTAAVGFSSGGFEARYGDKMSSVLDITYKQPEELEGSVSASLLGANAYVGSKSGKFTQATGFRYKRGTSLLNTLDKKGYYDPTFLDLQTYMSYHFTPKLELNFIGNISQNTYNFSPESQTTVFGTAENATSFEAYYDGSEEDQFKTLFGALNLKYDVSKATTLGIQMSAYQSKEYETYDITGEYWLNEALSTDVEGSDEIVLGTGKNQVHARNRLYANVFNLSHSGSHRFETNTLQWGIGYQKEEIKDQVKEWEKRDSMGYSLPTGGETVDVYKNLSAKNEIQSNRFSGYLQDTYKFNTSNGLISLVAGVRGSYWDFNKEFILSPRASIGFVPEGNQNLTFRFATGLYYQAPFYKEFRKTVTDDAGNSVIELNRDIKSQRSVHFIGGGDYTFNMMERPFKFTAEAYYKKIDDLIPYSVNNVKISYAGENLSNGYTTGLDMKLFGEFVPGVDSWLNFSLMKARQEVNGEMVPMPTDQPYKVSLFFNDYVPNNDRITVNLRLIWSKGLPFSTPKSDYTNSFRGKDYRRVDIGGAYLLFGEKDKAGSRKAFKAFKNIWLGVDVFNLFDIKNVDSYSWISDNNSGLQFAVPNYLTGRQLNLKLLAEF